MIQNVAGRRTEGRDSVRAENCWMRRRVWISKKNASEVEVNLSHVVRLDV